MIANKQGSLDSKVENLLIASSDEEEDEVNGDRRQTGEEEGYNENGGHVNGYLPKHHGLEHPVQSYWVAWRDGPLQGSDHQRI